MYPGSIAVIGVSANRKKIGHTIVKNLLSSKFRGRVYCVNSHEKKILGKRVFPKVTDIPLKVDLAVISVPAQNVSEALEECGRKKIKNIIVISAGFSETGEDGKRLEENIRLLSEKYQFTLLGPNCLGILNSENALNASFAEGMIRKGKIGFVSQSGAICSAMLDWSHEYEIGFSKFVSLGNKAVLEEDDFFEYFSSDKNTEVVLAYIEGIRHGKKFIETAKLLTQKKPLIVMKGGITPQGKNAVFSHTGSIAGDERVTDTVFRQLNIIRAKTLEQFFHLALFFARYKNPFGNNVCVLSNAGGPAVITTDLIEKTSLRLAQLSEQTKSRLREALPKAASVRNPVDIVGDADAKRYDNAIRLVVGDPGVDSLIVLLTPQTVTEVSNTAKIIVETARTSHKPIICCFLGGKRVLAGVQILRKHHVPEFLFPNEAIETLDSAVRYFQSKVSVRVNDSEAKYKKITLRLDTYRELQEECRRIGRGKPAPVSTCEKLLSLYEIPRVESVLVASETEISEKISRLHYPLVAKIASPDISHKTDIGGVITNIQNVEEAKKAYSQILRNAQTHAPEAKISGTVFQEFVSGRLEVIVGAKRDPQFGAVVLFGIGGVYVEVLKDTAVRLVPVGRTEAQSMLKEVKFSPILFGARNLPGYDTEAIIDIINKLSQLMTDFSEIQEIECNPVLVAKEHGGLLVADCRMTV